MFCIYCSLSFSASPHTGQVLVKYILKPLIMFSSLYVEVVEQPELGTVLTVQSEENQTERPAPAQVYTKILSVLKTLHRHLFGTSKRSGGRLV